MATFADKVTDKAVRELAAVRSMAIKLGMICIADNLLSTVKTAGRDVTIFVSTTNSGCMMEIAPKGVFILHRPSITSNDAPLKCEFSDWESTAKAFLCIVHVEIMCNNTLNIHH